MAIDKASLTTKKDRSLNYWRDKKTQSLLSKAEYLANKYYHTTDLKALTPHQLDKIITWTTNQSPDAGKNKQRKAQKQMQKGKWFKNSKDKSQAAKENKKGNI